MYVLFAKISIKEYLEKNKYFICLVKLMIIRTVKYCIIELFLLFELIIWVGNFLINDITNLQAELYYIDNMDITNLSEIASVLCFFSKTKTSEI